MRGAHRAGTNHFGRIPLPCIGFAATVLLASPLIATTVRRLNLEELTSRAQTIVVARCVEVAAPGSRVRGMPVREVVFEVERSIKGSAPRRLVVRQIAEPGIAGIPDFADGEDTVLFLYGESGSGLTSPVGLGQGKFVIERAKDGRRLVRNGTANRGLLEGLSATGKAALGEAGWRDGGDITVEDLIRMVDRLAARGETRP